MNGNHFIGNFKEGAFEGQGKFVWHDGSSYVGNFKNGMKHGHGKWTVKGPNCDNEQGQSVYKGEFDKDYKQGFGIMNWISGGKYEG